MIQIVWLKKDLRLEDHGALMQAAKKGPVLPLYIVEPTLWQQPDMSTILGLALGLAAIYWFCFAHIRSGLRDAQVEPLL